MQLTSFCKASARWLLLLLLLGCSSLQAAVVKEMRIWPAPGKTRVVFDLTAPAGHKLFLMRKPDRLVVDIAKSSLKTSNKKFALGKTPIKRIRHARQPNGDLRVVFDLRHKVKSKSFFLKKNKKVGDRLVLDLTSAKATKKEKKKPRKSIQQSKRRDIIIAVDAGHGGEDPGAIGPGRIREKNVVLAISRQIALQVNTKPGFKAVLIRNGDYYIGLKERWVKARKHRADLFVSVHADAFTNSKANGSSVYALSNKGSTSAAARFLAEAANNSDKIGGVALEHGSDLAFTLVDLSLNYKKEASTEIGSKVLHSMGKISKLHSKRVERASFAVLKSPDIPSILVETGFISNPREARNLNTPSYQRKMAKSIVTGIERYFKKKPPAGTLLAWQLQRKQLQAYQVIRGDSLSVIAKRFRVSVAAIRKQNNLKNDVLKVGQWITIPAS